MIMITKKHIAEATGIKPRTILDWTSRGYLKPIVPATGQGKIPEYDKFGIVQALVLKNLSKYGVSLSKFSQIFYQREPFPTLHALEVCMDSVESEAKRKKISIPEVLEYYCIDLVIFDDCSKVLVDFFDTTKPAKPEKLKSEFDIKITVRMNKMLIVAYDYMKNR
jgi:DNA-binding transcriptional MerR regulator